MKRKTTSADDDALPEDADLPLCPRCGTPAQTSHPPMPVAGPLPIAPTPGDDTPACPDCGAPWPADLGPPPQA